MSVFPQYLRMKKKALIIADIWTTVKNGWQRKKSFTFSLLTLVTGTSVAQIIYVAAVPILTRLYTPEEFGIFAVYLSIMAILIPLLAGRYESAIPLATSITHALELVILCLAITSGMVFLSVLGIWFFADFLVSITKTPGLRSYLWIIPFSLLGTGTYQVFSNLSLRTKFFQDIARTKVVQSVGQVILQVGFGFWHWGSPGLIVGDFFGKSAGSGSLAWKNWKYFHEQFAEVTYAGIKRMGAEYKNFPIFTIPSTLLTSAGLQLPNFFLAAFYGTKVVGWFALSQRLLGIPMTFIGLALTQVVYTEVAQRLREQPALVKPLFYKSTRYSILATIPIVILGLGSPWLFGIVFGNNWAEAGVYTIYLIPYYIFQFTVISNNLLIVTGFNHWQLGWDAIRLIVTILIFWIGPMLNWNPSKTIISYSLAMVILYIVLFGLNMCIIKSLEKI